VPPYGAAVLSPSMTVPPLTVSLVGLMAMGFSISLLPARVTHATCSSRGRQTRKGVCV
jgi:hypothetical protein